MLRLPEGYFFFDANCDSPQIIDRLRSEHEFTCTGRLEQFGEPQLGRAGVSDERLFEFCQEQQFVIVTKNCRDFERLVETTGGLHDGLILIRDGQMNGQKMYEALVELLLHHPDSFFGRIAEI
jgi:predicted nuclease of predicted toxin-antitoxin system